MTILFACLTYSAYGKQAEISALKQQLSAPIEDTTKVRILESLAWEYRDLNWDSTYFYAWKAIQLGAQTGPAIVVAYALNDLASYQIVRGAFDRAERCLIKSLALRNSYGTLRDRASGYNACGNFCLDREDYDRAITAFQVGLNILQPDHAPALQAKLHDNLGTAYRYLDRFPEALQEHRKALALTVATGDQLAIARSQHNLAVFFQSTQRLEPALQYYDQALQGYIALGNETGIASVLEGKGVIFYRRGAQDSALYYLQHGYTILKGLGDTMQINACYTNLALVYAAMGKHAEAEHYQQLDLDFCLQHEFKAGAIVAAINLASIQLEQDRYKEALALTDQACSLGSLSDGLRLTVYDIRSRAYAGLGDYAAGLRWLGYHRDLQDSLAASMRRLQDLTDKYLAEKVEREKATQIARVASAKLELSIAENRSRTYFAIAVVLALALALAGLLYYTKIQRFKIRTLQAENESANAKAISQQHSLEISNLMQDAEVNALRVTMVSQERERHRIARNLHDRVGSKLSVVQMLFQSLQNILDPIPVKTKGQFDKAVSYLEEACQEVREVARSMHAGDLAHFGLQLALERFCDQVRSSGRLEVHFGVWGEPAALPQEVENEIYAIARTLVENILRHANASEFSLQLRHEPMQMCLEIRDDGRGFDPSDSLSNQGIGLRNVHERLALLGGTIRIISKAHQGCNIQIVIPIKPEFV